MAIPDRRAYLRDIVNLLLAQWPNNRTVNIVCHGHSVPAGYFATPMVDTFNAYPALLHRDLKHRFPYAVVNVIVTAIGGEGSPKGADRFAADVLCHRPDLVTIDYGLNDRRAGLAWAETAWRSMIEASLAAGAKVLLLTPTWDNSGVLDPAGAAWRELSCHAAQIRRLAAEYERGPGRQLRRVREPCGRGRRSHRAAVVEQPPQPPRARAGGAGVAALVCDFVIYRGRSAPTSWGVRLALAFRLLPELRSRGIVL